MAQWTEHGSTIAKKQKGHIISGHKHTVLQTNSEWIGNLEGCVLQLKN